MTTQEFAAKLTAENQRLVEKVQACKAPEEVYALAKDEGLTDTFDTFTAEMTKMYESVKDLSDEDMQNVAGGASTSEVVTITIGATAVSAGVLAASAASTAV